MDLNETEKKIPCMELEKNPDQKKDEEIRKSLLAAGNLPQHIAIIMDGDRRWAVERNLPKTDGHKYGRESVRDVVRACGQLGIKVLTLYTFSTENWSRPKTEVKTLMSWLRDSLLNEIGELHQNNVRLNAIGRVDGLPSTVRFALNSALEKTKENPVFYVQYCHARLQSLIRTTKFKPNSIKEINKFKIDFNIFEKQIIKKVFEWPKIIKTSSDKYEPHRIPYYLNEIATLFHSYWSKGNDDEKYRFIKQGAINKNAMIVIQLILLVLQNGMSILNVSLPDKM